MTGRYVKEMNRILAVLEARLQGHTFFAGENFTIADIVIVLGFVAMGSIFQIPGVQRTETFLSLADVEPANFTLALLDQMAERSGRDHAI